MQQQQQQRHLQVDFDNLSQDPLQDIDSKTADAHDLLTRYSDLAKIGYLDSALKVLKAAVEADRTDVLGRQVLIHLTFTNSTSPCTHMHAMFATWK